ncbi:MAG: imidazolonepropionase [Actinobacteria bacterium]|nr:imidazolonepropionase [Actinomycetota bacterium]
MPSLSLQNAASLVTFPGSGPIRGTALTQPDVLAGATVVAEGGRIASVGDGGPAEATFDATGCTIVAGFVDPHTHLPFYGWRADEDSARLSGLRYEQLHAGEGGIYRSARLLAGASDEQVLDFSGGMARTMLEHGTTTFETKSGYGLSIEAELRQLRLAKKLAEAVPQTVRTTCLAAHAVPKDHMAGEWIGRVATDLLPVVREEGLATACDIYIESIAFALEHAARLSETSSSLGLQMRVHADQLEDGQAGSFAARWGFRSADHLNHTSPDAVDDIAGGDTAAVLLPGATFTLRQNKKPPARSLVDAGAIVALGTDLNPGTSPISSMPFTIALACRTYGLRPAEALAAATVNAAYVLGLEGEIGRIAEGYRADLVVLDVPDIDHLPYRPDRNPVIATVCGGELVHVASSARGRLIR